MDTLKLVLVLLILSVVAFLVVYIIYKVSKVGIGEALSNFVKDPWSMFGPDKVITPKKVQDFIDEPANKPGGYTPWTPTIEEDEAYPPAWLNKGAYL